jgi:hypothetical protein
LGLSTASIQLPCKRSYADAGHWGMGGVDRSEARNDMSADSPAVEDDYEAQDIRDRRLLDRIADARARGDEFGSLRERTAMGELLAPYWFKVRRIVGWRLASISPDPTDVEDISSKVIEHMIKKLKKTTDLGGAPFSCPGLPRRPYARHRLLACADSS